MKHIERLHPNESTYNTEQMYNSSVSENSEPSAERDLENSNEDDYKTEIPEVSLSERLSFAGIPPPFSLNQMLLDKPALETQI